MSVLISVGFDSVKGLKVINYLGMYRRERESGYLAIKRQMSNALFGFSDIVILLVFINRIINAL